MEGKVDIKIPDEFIQSVIATKIAESLGGKEKELVKAVVDMALTQKKDSWSRETLLVSKIKDMIQQSAEETFKEWITGKKELIKKAVAERLKKEDGFVEKVAEKLVTGMASSFHTNVYIETKIDD